MFCIQGVWMHYLTIILILQVTAFVTADDDTFLTLDPTSTGINLIASKGTVQKLSGTIGVSRDFSNVKCVGEPTCQVNNYTLNILPIADGFKITWNFPDRTTEVFQDCFNFDDGVQWYGGPESKLQSWPIQKLNISGDAAYVLKQNDNVAIAERYWLNSLGAYIYVDSRVPLFVDQNTVQQNKVCFIAKLEDPYILRGRVKFLEYHIIIKSDPKEAHLHAINNFLGKPSGHPNEKMISETIWTTWAKYKTNISDETVLEFAKDIRNNGFQNGQLEIDDNWETCYGAQVFSGISFPDIGNTIRELKKLNFRVTLWIHPFVNNDCQDNANTGISRGYFVFNVNGSTNGSWWNGNPAHQIDFTIPEAANWWSSRLRKLQKHPGIDGFKFDAGETDYGPQPSYYPNLSPETVPGALSESYLRACANFGSFAEVRSGWRTQDLPLFVRMHDKDSNWGENNGLYTLITTLLQMNINGYTMVLPDMIGGNGYNNKPPSAELLVRWTQANTFMPAMQFSYAPWEYQNEKFNASDIVLKFVQLHEKYSNQIIKAMQESITNGRPVNPPIWWIDPTDSTALACDDEFLLGEEILVAPVITEGATSRSVYLPKGSWIDGNNGTTYEGPTTIDYIADISTLPYFILNKS